MVLTLILFVLYGLIGRFVSTLYGALITLISGTIANLAHGFKDRNQPGLFKILMLLSIVVTTGFSVVWAALIFRLTAQMVSVNNVPGIWLVWVPGFYTATNAVWSNVKSSSELQETPEQFLELNTNFQAVTLISLILTIGLWVAMGFVPGISYALVSWLPDYPFLRPPVAP